MYATHHIAGIQPGRKELIRFSLGEDVVQPYERVNVWSMQKRFPFLKVFFDLWGRPLEQKTLGRPEGQIVRSVLDALGHGQPVDRKRLLQTMSVLLRLAPGPCVREMKNQIDHFSRELPAQYEKVFRRLDLSLAPRDELLLYACSPDIYLWVPPLSQQPKRLLICFGTKSNTLNMPTAMAHYRLARLGIAIMYVGNRPKIDPGEGLPGMNLVQSAKLIKDMAAQYGFEELYGMGTSLGGYVVCRYAKALELKRVLNFSGYPGDFGQGEGQITVDSMTLGYPKESILTVLSKTDEVDQRICKRYDEAGFVTERVWVNSPSHGSFSSAFLEDRLDDCFDWLFK